MKIQESLQKIIDNNSDYWERDYDLKRIAEESYNLGIEQAAENAKTTTYVDCCAVEEIVDKESILKLKI